MSRVNREVNMYESIRVGREYTMTTKELQYLIDRAGDCFFESGELYEVKNKRICPGRYRVWAELKKF